jgi:NAD(P)-dependent dehydrogenase (short-subunit alcohol dehydrogenase family)
MLSTEDGEEAFISTVPMGRMCTPQDVGNAVSYLASDQAEFITGVNLPVRHWFCQ